MSRHLKVLEAAGLISRSRSAQWRNSRLEAAPLRGVAAYMEKYRRHWDESLNRLERHLGELQRRDKP
jgi:DNA-binding transcriptional ArsR family regulator